MSELKDLILACKKEQPKAQKELYDTYAPVLFSICKRYLSREDEAEDALMEGFYKILTKLDQFSFNGSFEGWMKRIVVNECLMKIRKKTNLHMVIDNLQIETQEGIYIEQKLAYEEILSLFKFLPPGYRTVFNLYAIEGYKHREIAEILEISINTSKSQYLLAKKKLQSLIKKKHLYKAN